MTKKIEVYTYPENGAKFVTFEDFLYMETEVAAANDRAERLKKEVEWHEEENHRLRDALRYMVENPEDVESFHRIASVALGEEK